MKTGPSGGLAQRFLNSKLTPLLIAASLAAGVGGLLTTPREEEPQIRVPMIDVAVGLPGANPREVERRIVEPLERAIWEVPGVEYVYSVSQTDGALITARFKVGTEPELALTRLYGKLLANADRSPAGATPPLVTLHGINEVPILTLTLSGGGDAKAGIGRWIDFYNHHRPHTAHGGRTPVLVYRDGLSLSRSGLRPTLRATGLAA